MKTQEKTLLGIALAAALTSPVCFGGASAAAACADGRFLISKEVFGGDTEFSRDAIAIEDSSTIRTAGGCGPVPAKVKTTRTGTARVVATFPPCGRFRGKARLRAVISADCGTMNGMLISKRPRSKVSFGATSSFCGDGIVDPARGEACDDGISGDGCEPGCRETSGSTSTTTTTTTTTSTTTTTPAPRCGDRHLDSDELCDDGNEIGGDGCEPDCTPTLVFEVCPPFCDGDDPFPPLPPSS